MSLCITNDTEEARFAEVKYQQWGGNFVVAKSMKAFDICHGEIDDDIYVKFVIAPLGELYVWNRFIP